MKRILLLTSITACLSSEQVQRRDYDARYQQAVHLCGNAEAAFQAGYNAGYAGDKMRGEWTEFCVPAVQAQTVAGYQDGFLKGANNAPIRVVHTVTPMRGRSTMMPLGASTSVASQCTFDSDCGGSGFHCRDHECLGYGGLGERCVFNEDCSNDHCFGGTCRE
jgi:hypothetical protein